jgi:hypothetical protein
VTLRVFSPKQKTSFIASLRQSARKTADRKEGGRKQRRIQRFQSRILRGKLIYQGRATVSGCKTTIARNEMQTDLNSEEELEVFSKNPAKTENPGQFTRQVYGGISPTGVLLWCLRVVCVSRSRDSAHERDSAQ